jgi:hypothetical protein
MNEISINKSRPINIAIQSINKKDQYSLNNTCFDPTQNSPPSLWKQRLNKRIGDSPVKYSQNKPFHM